MHVGIIAACLPTLQPLFASFFGSIGTMTKGRTTGSNTIGAPFYSRGYMKHNDMQAQEVFALKDMSEGSQSQPRNPYDVDAMLEKEGYSVTTSGGRQSQSVESSVSILSHKRSGTLQRGMTILRTTEVEIRR